jgi:hypothetical protein
MTKRTRTLLQPPAWLVPNVMVDYHAVIGGPVTEAGLKVESLRQISTGAWVALLWPEPEQRAKLGAIPIETLSPHGNDTCPGCAVEYSWDEVDTTTGFCFDCNEHRDEFARAAVSGILSSRFSRNADEFPPGALQRLASEAFKVAGAMLLARRRR